MWTAKAAFAAMLSGSLGAAPRPRDVSSDCDVPVCEKDGREMSVRRAPFFTDGGGGPQQRKIVLPSRFTTEAQACPPFSLSPGVRALCSRSRILPSLLGINEVRRDAHMRNQLTEAVRVYSQWGIPWINEVRSDAHSGISSAKLSAFLSVLADTRIVIKLCVGRRQKLNLGRLSSPTICYEVHLLRVGLERCFGLASFSPSRPALRAHSLGELVFPGQ